MGPSLKSFLLRLARARPFQPLWLQANRVSLIGMNFWSSHLAETGEIDALRYVADRLSSVAKPVIFDVGANVGDYAIACDRQFGGRAAITCFEPSPTTANLLREHLGEAAARIRIEQVGMSEREETMTLFSSEPGSSIASVHQLDRPLRPMRDEYSETVQLTTLDDYCAKHGVETIDFLKLDIEGHEVAALRGAKRMIGEGRIRFLQFEFGENNVSSRTFMSDFDKLLGQRFRFFRVVPGGLVPWRYEGGRSEVFATMNYLCERIDPA